MTDAQCAAGDRVDGRAVWGAVVGDQRLDADAVAGVVLDGAAQEPDGGDGLLVSENFDVGQTGRVVDSDVHVLPARLILALAGSIGLGRRTLEATVAMHAVAGPAVDAAELLDVDVNQLAGPGSLVAHRGLQAEPAELAHPDSGEDPRDRRQRHSQTLGDLRTGQPHTPER